MSDIYKPAISAILPEMAIVSFSRRLSCSNLSALDSSNVASLIIGWPAGIPFQYLGALLAWSC